MKFLHMIKYNENGTPPPQSLLDALAKNREEAKQAGVLLEIGGLFPSAMGARIRLSGGRIACTDGPFAESKEIIGGYSVYQVNSKQEAVDWAYRFLKLFVEHWPEAECETEIRQIMDKSACSE